MLDEIGGIILPHASTGIRKIQGASSAHCTANTVLGSGAGVRFEAESKLELRNLYLLNAMKNVAKLQEQVRFFYGWDPKNPSQHVFDVVATLDCDARIAFTVKPEVRLVSGRFEAEMQEVTWWVHKHDFADEVRIMSEADVNSVDLRNAKILAAVREPDEQADLVALEVVKRLPNGGGQSLRDLTLSTGMSERGYRALIRLMRTGVLRLQNHQVIGPKVVVALSETKATIIHPQDRKSLMVRPMSHVDDIVGQQTAA